VKRALLVVVALAAGLFPTGSSAEPAPLVAGPGYYRPAPIDGAVFPVARSNFFSVVEFDDGWHDPRFRKIDGKWRLVGVHEGIDIMAEKGTPVLAFVAGTVENVGWTFYSGTRVGIRGLDGHYYLYCHLSAVASGIVPGAAVSAGSLLGRVGNTGYGGPGHEDEFPAHLHFGIEAGGVWVNPYGALVRTYREAVRVSREAEVGLSALAAEGDTGAWRSRAERLYTTFGIPLP
jgi:murein DD-endopeptidase MepM/ murein hydrolase activator NlpD